MSPSAAVVVIAQGPGGRHLNDRPKGTLVDVDWEIEYSPDGMQGPWESQGATSALGQTEALETMRQAAAGGALPSGYYRLRPVDEERWRIFRWAGSGRFELAYG